MNWMTFKDGTRIEIAEGASLARITHTAKNDALAVFVVEKCTSDNVKHITFSQPGEDGAVVVTGEYDNLTLAGDPVRDDNIVTISLKEEA